ncbi:MAG: hypothetical protein ACLQVI_39190 [Polyangiaceae bacterium]
MPIGCCPGSPGGGEREHEPMGCRRGVGLDVDRAFVNPSARY